jgi:hypothetical protein
MAISKDIKVALQEEEIYQEQISRIRRLAYRRFQIDDENLLNFSVIETPSTLPEVAQSFELKDRVDFKRFNTDPVYNAAVIAAIQGALQYMASNEGVSELDNPETQEAIKRAALQDLLEADNLQN